MRKIDGRIIVRTHVFCQQAKIVQFCVDMLCIYLVSHSCKRIGHIKQPVLSFVYKCPYFLLCSYFICFYHHYLVTGRNPDPDAFKIVRSPSFETGVVEAEVQIGDATIRAAVVSGLGNVRKLLEAIEHGEVHYDFVEVMAEWNTIGFVPFKEKDKIYKEYHEAVDQQFDRLKVDQNDRKMQSFRNNLNEMTSGERGKGRLFSERDKLMRMYERMKNELQTYENNIGFLSISSKGGGGLLKEMERKIEKLKEDMALTVKKIDAIDENLE